jgi:hypothetical protein
VPRLFAGRRRGHHCLLEGVADDGTTVTIGEARIVPEPGSSRTSTLRGVAVAIRA